MPGRLRWPLLLVALAAMASGLPSLGGELVLDDAVAIEGSTCVTGELSLRRIFGTNFWCEVGRTRSIQSWRPWPVLAWWFLERLGGGEAWPFRALSLLLHAVCACLAVVVGRQLGLPARAATIGGLVFAVLAIHMDAVAYATGAAGLWSTAALLAAVSLRLAQSRWVLPFVVLACLSKESGVLVLPLLALIELRPPQGRRRPWSLAAAAVAVVAVLTLRAAVLDAWTGTRIPAHVNPLVGEPWLARLPTALALLGRYVVLTATGHPLAADYSVAAIGVGADAGAGWMLAGAGVLGALGVVSFRRWRQTEVVFLSLWLLGAFGVVANVLFLLPALFAERLFYDASVPLCLLLGIAADAGLEHRRSRIPVAVAVGTFLLWQLVASLRHAHAFRTPRSIVETTVAHAPDNARARLWHAWLLIEDGDVDAAFDEARAAAELRPGWGGPLAVQAALLDQRGEPERALVLFRAAMERDARDAQVADLFIQFLLRYGHRGQARVVYAAHVEARGEAAAAVTVP